MYLKKMNTCDESLGVVFCTSHMWMDEKCVGTALTTAVILALPANYPCDVIYCSAHFILVVLSHLYIDFYRSIQLVEFNHMNQFN